MKKLGISIYIEKASIDDNKKYIKLASKYGFDRIFSCLLSVDPSKKEQIIKNFKEVNMYARECNMEVILDVSPRVFNDLGISYKDLSFFKEVGADGFRLDVGFTGSEESLMTFNEHGLLVEINMSLDTAMIDNIMDYMPNTKNLIGCHNFYPHNYTGLPYDFFVRTTNRFKKYGLRTAAFINSPNATFGPWPVGDGLCTLEMHRTLPIDVQLKHYVALNGLIDDVLISNCFPTENELKLLGSLNRDVVEFDVKLASNVPDVEKSIVVNDLHFRRGDMNDNMIRSTMSRVNHMGHIFKVFNPVGIKRGDLIIESSEYGHYAGELQIALVDMKNTGKSNVVGKIREEELFLLDYILPWQKFRFREIKNDL